MQAAYWSFYASLPGYITAYMLDQGMSAATLGILLALQMGAAFLGSIFWGSVQSFSSFILYPTSSG